MVISVCMHGLQHLAATLFAGCAYLAKVVLTVGWGEVVPLGQGVLKGMKGICVRLPMPPVEAFHSLPNLQHRAATTHLSVASLCRNACTGESCRR